MMSIGKELIVISTIILIIEEIASLALSKDS
jgi:hypothetical protein